MRKRHRAPLKVVDDTSEVRCASGKGIIREEVWQDHGGNIVKYNLAFINHHLYADDNGRVLGYDNAHGGHERHFRGSVEEIAFDNYGSLLTRFLDEVGALRKEKE